MDGTSTTFEHLITNIPLWLDSLTSLSSHLQRCQHDLQELSAQSPPSPPRQARSGSMESIRAVDLDLPPTSAPQPSPTLAQQQLQAAIDGTPKGTSPTTLPRRKRKAFATASLASAAASNADAKYRTRKMIIVYYDSVVQDSFEAMVRNIGTARSLIRKGKMARRMEEMTAALDAAATPAEDKTADDEENFVPKVSFVRRGARGPTRDMKMMRGPNTSSTIDGGKSDKKDVFDVADERLDKAQALCERGAHQFLRDGDCDEEIQDIRAAFDFVLELANNEKEALERKQMQHNRYETKAQDSDETRVYKPKRIRLLDAMPPGPTKRTSPGMIEVDHDDDADNAYAIHG
ncbi:MAG: hypothetical protein M1836_006344 [Candelina mexicana]|nr:MAG: hypothetical protein M1836_006344 [Candelina mexicana]